MSKIPKWAKKSVEKAVKAGLVLNPEQASLDFYRFLTVLDRKGVL